MRQNRTWKHPQANDPEYRGPKLTSADLRAPAPKPKSSAEVVPPPTTPPPVVEAAPSVSPVAPVATVDPENVDNDKDLSERIEP